MQILVSNGSDADLLPDGTEPLPETELTTYSVYSSQYKFCRKRIYRKVSNIRRTLVSNEIVDHSDVVGASPVGAAPGTSSFST